MVRSNAAGFETDGVAIGSFFFFKDKISCSPRLASNSLAS